jgi:hypothetical protein
MNYIRYGEREAPDLGVVLNGNGPQEESQLDRIEANQARILAEIAAIRLALVQPSRRQSTPPRSQRGRGATGS